MSTNISLGLDWGRGNFKVSGHHGTAWLPSHVAYANGATLRKADAGIRIAQPQYDVQFEGNGSPHHFYVGHNAPVTGTAIEALDFTDYTGAMDQRALLYAAVSEYCKVFNLTSTPDTPLTAKVSVGVPQKTLVGEDAGQRKSAIRQWLTTSHTWTAKSNGRPQEHRLDIEKVGVGSQAVGALYYYMTRPDRSYRTEVMDAILTRPVGILSLGSSTLELTAVQLRDNNGRPRQPEILPDLEGSFPLGAYHMLNMSSDMEGWSLGYRDQQFRNAPKSQETALATWLRRVQGHINQRWGNQHKDFAAVFIVGGMLKVPSVRDWARKQFRNAVLAGFDLGQNEDDCITAISQGLYRQIPA